MIVSFLLEWVWMTEKVLSTLTFRHCTIAKELKTEDETVLSNGLHELRVIIQVDCDIVSVIIDIIDFRQSGCIVNGFTCTAWCWDGFYLNLAMYILELHVFTFYSFD